MSNFDDEESKDKMEKWLEEFRNRKIYKELSLEILATISDNDLEQVIVDYIGTKIKDYQTALADISNMATGFQMMYSTWILEGEVNNGGFNQFFYNSSGEFADMALRSLKTINATDYYAILHKAIEIHLNEKEKANLQSLYAQRTLQAFSDSYKLTSLGECDSAFYKLKDRLSELRIQFIRSHPESFVGN